jgi:hypothetical protein
MCSEFELLFGRLAKIVVDISKIEITAVLLRFDQSEFLLQALTEGLDNLHST